MDAEDEKLIEALRADADRYRDKHTLWKSAYYGAILTVSGILVAVTELADPGATWITRWMQFIIMLSCLVSIICVILVMRQFIRLYDQLGYHHEVSEQKDIDIALRETQDAFGNFKREGKRRKCFDRAICISFVASLVFSVALVPVGWVTGGAEDWADSGTVVEESEK